MPGPDGPTKPALPKAPASYSSFINKNTSGKKFVPKAVRRRPAAAAAATVAAATSTSTAPAASTEPPPAPTPVSPTEPAPLPTPADSQDHATSSTLAAPSTPQLTPAAPVTPAGCPQTWSEPTTQPIKPILTPAPTSALPHATPITPTAPTPDPTPSEQETAPPAQTSLSEPAWIAVNHARADNEAQAPAPAPAASPPAAPPRKVVKPPIVRRSTAARKATVERQSPPPNQTSPLPANDTVPHPAEASTTASKKRSAPDTGGTEMPRSPVKRQKTGVEISQEDTPDSLEQEMMTIENLSEQTSARGKRKADGTVVDTAGDQAETVLPPAKRRNREITLENSRIDSARIGTDSNPSVSTDQGPNTSARVSATPKNASSVAPGAAHARVDTTHALGATEDTREDVLVGAKRVASKPRKPRKPKQKKTPTPSAEGEGGGEKAPPKRRGRAPRSPTPSDAEDQVIDPDAVFMDSLASNHIRTGKVSNREKEMRKIDWDAVKQRRREEDMRVVTTREAQAAADRALELSQVEQPTAGPRMRMVDGRIELIEDSGTIDREADANREIDAMVVTEEDDLTTRINSRSFMKTGKRFPNEFVLPGQGIRWTADTTEQFYQGLRTFGTDFQMIAHMFPGATRRSIKMKFNREERDSPEAVKAALRGESQLASHWGEFLQASQLQEDAFADAEKIKQDMREEEVRMRQQIDAANLEREERDRQKKIAGMVDEDPNNKDTATGKKKRKQKEKQVTFHEEGVEILGDVDDDPNWGQ